MPVNRQHVMRRRRFATGLSCLLSLTACTGVLAETGAPPAAAIASSSALATDTGREIIDSGGNAFDAAVAMTAVLAVTEPHSAGLGGGGVWLLHHAGDKSAVVIDGLVTTPELAHPSMLPVQEAGTDNDEPLRGAVTAGIPGVPAALVHLSQRYGRLPLGSSLAPAIRFAEKGFIPGIELQLISTSHRRFFTGHPGAARVFAGDGSRVLQPALANTFREIAIYGRSGFYEGKQAAALVNEVNRQGGIWTLKDLSSYQVKEREPLLAAYHAMQIVTTPLPSAGGIVLVQSLGILSRFQLQAMPGVVQDHLIIESLRRAYRDRWAYARSPESVLGLHQINPEYLDALAMTLDPDQATPSRDVGDTPGIRHAGTQTTHFSIIDFEGNRVAATLSLNSLFGSGYLAAGSGVLLNNELSIAAGMTDSDDTDSQVFTAGARRLTNMTPVFLEHEGRLAILGTPGGDRIASMLVQAALAFHAGQDPAEWVKAPRFHHQYLPDVVEFERDGLAFEVQRRLFDMGHRLAETTGSFGRLQVVVWDRNNNRVSAITDPRGDGSAVVFKR